MSKMAQNFGFRNSLVTVIGIGLCCAAVTASQAVLVTITNTSSSHYTIRNESAGNAIVTNVTSREGVITVDLPDNSNFRLRPAVEGDQGSHYFKVVGGQITYDLAIPPTRFFTNYGPTSLTIGSIPVHIRLLSSPSSPVGVLGGGFGEQYFATLSLNPGDTAIVNLSPTDGPGNGNFNFIGNWKNIFMFGGAQHAPMQLGPNGITSMTTDAGGFGTIVPSSIVQTNFTEGGIGYNGFRFTLDRSFDSHPTDGSQWLFFAVPEPSAALLLGLGGVMMMRKRRKA